LTGVSAGFRGSAGSCGSCGGKAQEELASAKQSGSL
jgi:hypothetical protein